MSGNKGELYQSSNGKRDFDCLKGGSYKSLKICLRTAKTNVKFKNPPGENVGHRSRL